MPLRLSNPKVAHEIDPEYTLPMVGPETSFWLYTDRATLDERKKCERGEPDRLEPIDLVTLEEKFDELTAKACKIEKEGDRMVVWSTNAAGYIHEHELCK